MIEFKRHVFNFKLDGKEYQVKHPTVSDIEKFQESATDNESIDTTINFLSDLGLPVEVSRGMEAEHLQIIVETVSGAKKN